MGRNDKDRGDRPDRRGPAIIAVVVVALGAGVWLLSQNVAGVDKPSAPPAPSVNLLPPPPPPPPPPPQPKTPPPPEKTEAPSPKPEDSPKPDNQPKQLTIAGPAQAGADSFGIGAGKGGGSAVIGGTGDGGPAGGGSFEESAYDRYLKSEFEHAIQANGKIDHAFGAADLAVAIGPDGRIVGLRLRRSTGNPKVDGELLATIARMRPLGERPPPQVKFPREIQIRGVRG